MQRLVDVLPFDARSEPLRVRHGSHPTWQLAQVDGLVHQLPVVEGWQLGTGPDEASFVVREKLACALRF